jgi:hypothetical protein
MFGLLPHGPLGESPFLFYSEAFINWHLLTVVVGRDRRNVGNVSGGKSGWILQQMPFMPEVNALPSNVSVNPPFMTWS